jgi:hypothetical protein
MCNGRRRQEQRGWQQQWGCQQQEGPATAGASNSRRQQQQGSATAGANNSRGQQHYKFKQHQGLSTAEFKFL